MSEIRTSCNLSDGDFEARRAELRAGLLPQARGREALPNGLALLFDATPELREELGAFVAFERECCPGLGFSVRDAAGGLRLEILGIDSSAGDFSGIGVAPSAEPPSGDESGILRRNWPRMLRSAGLGAVGAFVLFCLVPLGLVGILGAQLAAPLFALDNPWAVGAGAIVFSGLLWRWERKREAARVKRAEAEGCGC